MGVSGPSLLIESTDSMINKREHFASTSSLYLHRVSFRILVKGGGEGKCNNCQVKGGEDYSNT